jgi:dipeptidyl aminopeptidase/acylaminoacyl peptidase
LLGTTAGVVDFGDHDDQATRVQAVVDFFGNTDFLQQEAHRLPEGGRSNVPTSPVSRLVGGLITENVAAVARANPANYVSADDPPFLIIHGDRDLSVPHYSSEILATALKKAGVPTVFYTVPGGGHGDEVFVKAPLRDWVSEFLRAHFNQGLRERK